MLAVIALGAGAVALGAVDPDDPNGRAAVLQAGTCGGSTAPTVAAVELAVARRIYAEEAGGAETRRDAARVRGFAPLIAALQGGRQAAVSTAVHELVYKPHWHIVRLRVLRHGQVLADVGGPHVTVPVRGTLRANGHVLGNYVMSVQDDLGYQKLVTRFIGAPIDLYRGGSLVMGTLPAIASAPAEGDTVQAGGVPYRAYRLAIQAFPGGPLTAVLFVPSAPSSQACAGLRLSAWGSVARHVAARLRPLSSHYQSYADVMRTVTGGRVLVREGARRLVGGGPRRLPTTGTTRFGGRVWTVYSWQPAAGQRVYFLAPSG